MQISCIVLLIMAAVAAVSCIPQGMWKTARKEKLRITLSLNGPKSLERPNILHSILHYQNSLYNKSVVGLRNSRLRKFVFRYVILLN